MKDYGYPSAAVMNKAFDNYQTSPVHCDGNCGVKACADRDVIKSYRADIEMTAIMGFTVGMLVGAVLILGIAFLWRGQ